MTRLGDDVGIEVPAEHRRRPEHLGDPRAERGHLAQQPVARERDAEHQRDPRQLAGLQRQPQHAGGGDGQRDPLHPTRPLLQQREAEQQAAERAELERLQAQIDELERAEKRSQEQ